MDDAGAVDGGVCSQRRPVIAFRADARCASSPSSVLTKRECNMRKSLLVAITLIATLQYRSGQFLPLIGVAASRSIQARFLPRAAWVRSLGHPSSVLLMAHGLA